VSKLNYFLKGNTKIAYRYYKRSKKSLVFIHGLLSDMNGKKSTYFNNYCRRKKISFLCFDFQGHGKSNGDFVNFGIGDWFKNLKDLLNYLKIENPILIGSSMGGWVAMLYALYYPTKVKKLIGIAPAPDFTVDLLWKELSTKDKKQIKSNQIVEKKVTDDFIYKYSPNLFLNSEGYLIKNLNKTYKGEVILFHGSEDLTVPHNYNDRFYKNKKFPKLINVTIKNADHSMSDSLSLRNISIYI